MVNFDDVAGGSRNCRTQGTPAAFLSHIVAEDRGQGAGLGVSPLLGWGELRARKDGQGAGGDDTLPRQVWASRAEVHIKCPNEGKQAKEEGCS